MSPDIQARIAAARAAVLARQPVRTIGQQIMDSRAAQVQDIDGKILEDNLDQDRAVQMALAGHSFCMIGSAGTGKTTTTRRIVKALISANRLPTLEQSTKHLRQHTPGMVLISYTRRAVRNIARQMPDDFKSHCITYHKLVEYEPELVEVELDDGSIQRTKPFLPQRNQHNPLPSNLRLVIIDEASMLSLDFFTILCRAIPNLSNVQFIFIGDIFQLPPVYGLGVLGLQLNRLPVIELTKVYRQALESPIIRLALAIKDNKVPDGLKAVTKDHVEESTSGKVTLIPWKKSLDLEDAQHAVTKILQQWVHEGRLNFDTDVILCPWGKSFGTIEMNRAIGTALARKHGREVFEVIAGFEKKYFSVGDKVMVEKQDCEIVKIARNVRYIGQPPQPHSPDLDYWGWNSKGAAAHLAVDEVDIDELLDAFGNGDVEDRVKEASHAITVRFLDTGTEDILTSAGSINNAELAYAMSVHKSQGSEWERVFVITHAAHQKMLQQELIYTAFTRARRELTVIMPPTLLLRSASTAKIKGSTFKDKLKWYAQKLKETNLDELKELGVA